MEVIGLYTCSCHLFNSYDESEKAMKQKIPVGTQVQNRCNKNTGEVVEITDTKGFVLVKYGSYPKDIHLEHVQELRILSD